MRLILHTGAYWLLLDLRAAIPSWNPLRHTEFATIRLRLLKIASRIIEHASRIRIALASCCPEAETSEVASSFRRTLATVLSSAMVCLATVALDTSGRALSTLEIRSRFCADVRCRR
jgi:Transposase DDE domain group 1